MTDASPLGLGAILLVNGRVSKAMASPVGELDAKTLGFALGESSSQWGSGSAGHPRRPQTLGKTPHVSERGHQHPVTFSVTALALTQKFSNSNATLNYLGAELAITCEALGLTELNPIHLPGTANKEADFLSRPDTWKSTSMPKALEGTQVETPVERTTEWYHKVRVT